MLIANPTALGERIRQLRRAKGYSQEQLATKAKCNRKTIIGLEAGENVAMYSVFRVTAALGMALEVVDKRIDLKSLADLVEHDE
ncbi:MULTISPECIES: helix-turn-helix transcriptional regulator [Pseudomonas]|jgi:transcriptional regulator with XRE-family HTH domain|uniref:Helix-turn-helix transcriptional regulator n=1 Tax=Pseudomonas yamanorum TaxID=515393 RepID=A0A7Y8ECI6_9PSED|nr:MULTISPECIES: helix-turn-helix transcriptional regulator [Pseudomonas]MCS3415695.1 transcriptional regulator with XRE-family HTH domain [Pseudomonas sp. BIGb0558]MCS3434898.1 transcriptional regulator with XRE-family HTH domain [Pseudomonas sp. BIGb0450]NWD72499.1 helix-turn-helix transcriptional regulator [Pseudomonas gingeri]NWE12089.1 helix-turn-helix transcriptional regulator [Pseudomonas yamanorum]NWE76854.1 helix-turn-helix transcriptional regulator [Pseudomonas yamanorum]